MNNDTAQHKRGKQAPVDGSRDPPADDADLAFQMGWCVEAFICKASALLILVTVVTQSQALIRGLDEACLTGERLRLDRLPATAGSRFLTPSGSACLLTHQQICTLPPSTSLRPYRVRSDHHQSS